MGDGVFVGVSQEFDFVLCFGRRTVFRKSEPPAVFCQDAAAEDGCVFGHRKGRSGVFCGRRYFFFFAPVRSSRVGHFKWTCFHLGRVSAFACAVEWGRIWVRDPRVEVVGQISSDGRFVSVVG